MLRTWISFAVVSVALLVGQPAGALVVDASGDDNGVGAVSVSITGDDTIFVDKTFDEFGEIFIHFEVDSDGIYLIEETIDNGTGIDWTDFHWEIFGETDGDYTIGVDPDPAPFTEIDFTPPTAAEVYGGVVADGDAWDTFIELDLEGSTDGGLFTIVQFPSNDRPVPEPGTAGLLATALVAGILLRRRGR